MGRLRYSDTFGAVFELWSKENTVYGDKLKNNLEKLGLFTDKVQMGTGGKSGAGYQHIYDISIPIGNFSEKGFDTQLKEAIMKELF